MPTSPPHDMIMVNGPLRVTVNCDVSCNRNAFLVNIRMRKPYTDATNENTIHVKYWNTTVLLHTCKQNNPTVINPLMDNQASRPWQFSGQPDLRSPTHPPTPFQYLLIVPVTSCIPTTGISIPALGSSGPEAAPGDSAMSDPDSGEVVCYRSTAERGGCLTGLDFAGIQNVLRV